MLGSSACYRVLKSYKYQLVQDYSIRINIEPESDIYTPFISLSGTGRLAIRRGYTWDGASGPTVDTSTFMRGSLVHDALYQLMRGEYLDHRAHREYADDLLKQICIEDGMSAFRAWYVYKSVRWFGEKFAALSANANDELVWAPHGPPEPEHPADFPLQVPVRKTRLTVRS